ncbi:hypothetical protein [Ureibacillus acetophenoni]|uniref:Uncharacterized protein n=1 Tax=Ureibacillus acetophenoni TaxID=614649 RepID=A0A285URS5_9BACL|nr:hypothetical protein [Ureibacillus acetophenoni]SOC42941.1 hypothetical protein SAMN05877842_11410 [Ureibacillus acetophenoni]
MIVNSGGKLSKEYFVSYLKLVMNAKQCSLVQAKDHMELHFFKRDVLSFGEYTYSNFMEAVKDLS